MYGMGTPEAEKRSPDHEAWEVLAEGGFNLNDGNYRFKRRRMGVICLKIHTVGGFVASLGRQKRSVKRLFVRAQAKT